MTTDDFPHPLPRRHGTGIWALSAISQGRSRGWLAVHRILGPCDRAFKEWLTGTPDNQGESECIADFDAALGWRQGEESAVTASLLGLGTWLDGAATRHPDRAWREAEAVWTSRPLLADQARDIASLARVEANAWSQRDTETARRLRAESVDPIKRAAQSMTAALAPGDYPAPYRFLVSLSLYFVSAETGKPTLDHLRQA